MPGDRLSGQWEDHFLRHIIELRLGRIAYLVNEFSSLDVDGQLLRHAAEDVVTVSGGSIFCKCLVTEFIHNLQRIPERFDSPEMPLQGVVIEASGIANPMVIEQMLNETGLDETYYVMLIVTVVDPGSLPKLMHTLPNIHAQIESADVVLLNKADLFTPSRGDRRHLGGRGKLARLGGHIRKLTPLCAASAAGGVRPS